jgi:hypothetical protein
MALVRMLAPMPTLAVAAAGLLALVSWTVLPSRAAGLDALSFDPNCHSSTTAAISAAILADFGGWALIWNVMKESPYT